MKWIRGLAIISITIIIVWLIVSQILRSEHDFIRQQVKSGYLKTLFIVLMVLFVLAVLAAIGAAAVMIYIYWHSH